jgi:hypothetical protein
MRLVRSVRLGRGRAVPERGAREVVEFRIGTFALRAGETRAASVETERALRALGYVR